MLAVLRATPGRLDELTSGVERARLHAAPAEGEWSANEVLAHLRACADVWGEAILAILRDDGPTLKAVNPRTWIDRTDYPEQDFARSLRAFSHQRVELLAVLDGLGPDDWDRNVVVTGAGKPLERTVFDYAERLARHERPHVEQLRRALGG